MEPEEILDIHDQLNLYLVENRLKPASIIDFYPESPKLKSKVITSTMTITKPTGKKITEIAKELTPEVCNCLESYMISNRIAFERKSMPLYDPKRGKPNCIYTSMSEILYIGSSKKNLEALVNATNNTEMGLALGFPKEAVEAFLKVIDGEKRNGIYVLNAFTEAVSKGIKLPAWLAYISYTPEKLDLITGNVSESSKALGKKYQRFTRKNNPRLATELENTFYKENSLENLLRYKF